MIISWKVVNSKNGLTCPKRNAFKAKLMGTGWNNSSVYKGLQTNDTVIIIKVLLVQCCRVIR